MHPEIGINGMTNARRRDKEVSSMGVLEQAQQLGNYIVGHRTHSTSAEYADVTNPATGESLGKAFLNGKEDVAAKVLLCQ